jgi:hypothetical protein
MDMPVPQDPTIAIHFTGLLVFCFDNRRKYCQIGTLSKDDHELRLRFVKKGPDSESESEQMLTIPHGLIRQPSELWLDVEGDPSPKQQAAEPFIAGKLGDPPSDPQDFRRIVDLEGEHFYNRPLKVRRDVLKPVLFVAKGLFYTAKLTSDLYRTIPVAANGAKQTTSVSCSLGQIAEYVGANIYLTLLNQALVLRAGRNGSELLRLKKEKGTTYEILVENGDTIQAPANGDFHYYYDAFELNRGEPKILIESCGLPALQGREIPCLPVGLGKSDSFGFD